MLSSSVRHQLSGTFQLIIVTRWEHILLTFDFHHSIAHSFDYLEIKIQVIDVIRMPMHDISKCTLHRA